jgi:hypothetical protein
MGGDARATRRSGPSTAALLPFALIPATLCALLLYGLAVRPLPWSA